MFPPYINQSIDLLRKSVGWFLYDESMYYYYTFTVKTNQFIRSIQVSGFINHLLVIYPDIV